MRKKETMTLDMFREALPKGSRSLINQGLVDGINSFLGDTMLRENYRDNLIGYTSVLKQGKYRMGDYINAVRYVSFKLMKLSNIAAYVKTFPDRYQRMLDDNIEQKQMVSIASAYNKTKLVNKIYEMTLVPTYVLNADIHQRAINTQADLMIHAKSEKVRCDAANSILTHLKRPEAQKIELDVNVREDQAIKDLRESSLELVRQQRLMIEQGKMTTKEIAHSKLVIEDADYEEISQ